MPACQASASSFITRIMRTICDIEIPAVGLGCMNLSHAYGVPPPKEVGEAVLQKALDLGITHFDCRSFCIYCLHLS